MEPEWQHKDTIKHARATPNKYEIKWVSVWHTAASVLA